MNVIPITGELSDSERQYAELLNQMAEPKHSPNRADAIIAASKLSDEEQTALLAFADAQGERLDVKVRVKVNQAIAGLTDVLHSAGTTLDQGPRLTMADRVIDMPDVASNIVQTSNRPQPTRNR